MEEKELKTSPKQRVAIILIAILMLGSIVASYAAIVLAGNSASSSGISEERIAEYEAAYNAELATFQEITQSDFEKFVQYKEKIVAYDEAAANTGEVKVKDRLTGSGRTLAEGDSNYLAYYVGWCADGTVFDSSFNDATNPTAFTKAIDPSLGMIDGWTTGVVGMKLGGVRELTIPSEKAYASNREICGGYNKPLKFLVMAVANEEPLSSVAAAVDQAYMKLQYAVVLGIDYDAEM